VRGVERLHRLPAHAGVPQHRWGVFLNDFDQFWRISGGKISFMRTDWATIEINGAQRIIHRRPSPANFVLPWRRRAPVQAVVFLRPADACALTSVRECRDIQQEADMTPRIPENVSSWLVDWSFATIMGNTMPPRDPNDDAEDEDGDAEPDEFEPAVVREPDE
jgi:hypothetical protein